MTFVCFVVFFVLLFGSFDWVKTTKKPYPKTIKKRCGAITENYKKTIPLFPKAVALGRNMLCIQEFWGLSMFSKCPEIFPPTKNANPVGSSKTIKKRLENVGKRCTLGFGVQGPNWADFLGPGALQNTTGQDMKTIKKRRGGKTWKL